MKSGKKITKYDIGFDLQTFLEQQGSQPPSDPKALEHVAGGYIIAVGETFPPASELIFYGGQSGTTQNPIDAYAFDTWLEAIKWALENCEITQPTTTPPRGLERPRFPRVCFLRLYAEVKQI